MARPAVRILGVDPALRSTGLGVVVAEGGRLRAEGWNVVRAPAAWPHSRCLAHLYREIAGRLAGGSFSAVAIENPFGARNVATAFALGEVRGALLAACGEAGVTVFGYAPREVKQAVAARGGATKEQVRQMLVRMLGLESLPPLDASDALAVAICHEHRRTAIRIGMSVPL